MLLSMIRCLSQFNLVLLSSDFLGLKRLSTHFSKVYMFLKLRMHVLNLLFAMFNVVQNLFCSCIHETNSMRHISAPNFLFLVKDVPLEF